MSVSVEIYEYLTQVDYKAEDPADEQRLHWDGCEFNEYMIDGGCRVRGACSIT